MSLDQKELQYLFISTGDKFGYYTLRGMYKCRVVTDGVAHIILKEEFFKNLSTDKAKAESLAQEYADYYETRFVGNAEFELNEIKRAAASMKQEERAREERARAEIDARIEAEYTRSVNQGVFIAGKYIGKTAAEVCAIDKNYLFWVADQMPEGSTEKTQFNVNCTLAQNYIKENNLQASDFVGVVGDSVELELVLSGSNWISGQFPTLKFNAQDSNGNMVCFFSVAKGFQALKPCDTFKVKALVREHYTNRSGVKSTTLNKPKLQKV